MGRNLRINLMPSETQDFGMDTMVSMGSMNMDMLAVKVLSLEKMLGSVAAGK